MGTVEEVLDSTMVISVACSLFPSQMVCLPDPEFKTSRQFTCGVKLSRLTNPFFRIGQSNVTATV